MNEFPDRTDSEAPKPKSSSIRGRSMSPGNMGYRMPAEWEPHLGTWVSWPHNRDTWHAGLEEIERFYVCMISALAPFEQVHIVVPTAELEAHAQRLLERAEPRNLFFHRFQTNDAWIRDYGATFVISEDTEGRYPPLVAIDWGYNAWGGKYPPFDADDAVARQMATALQAPCVAGGMVLEGGAIDVNGQGILLTTEACLLDPRRNAGMTHEDVEARLRQMLSVQQVIWLEGFLEGDDTDGHIDQLARFVGPNRIAISCEEDATDVHYASSQRLLELLSRATNLEGQPFELVKMPGPAIVQREGRRMPAGYANFYIANQVVLAPQYGVSRDSLAVGLLQDLFPDRTVMPIDCRAAVVGLGAIHCLTQQIPGMPSTSADVETAAQGASTGAAS